MKNVQRTLLTLGGFWAFFGFGFVDNLKGPLLPEMVRSGRFDYAQSASLILASYIGFIIATLGSGALADRFSHRSVLWLAGWCVLCGLGCMPLCTSMSALVVCMLVMGLGLGAIELGANGLMIQLHSDDRGRYLNLLSVFHGCGSLIVPLAAAQLIDTSWRWQAIYALCASMALPLLLLFFPRRTNATHRESDTNAHSQSSAQLKSTKPYWLSMGFTPVMWCYYGLIAAYVATELSMGAWMMEYLQQHHQFTVDLSSRYLSAFFVMLMLGRLLGAWIVERVNYLLAVAVALSASAVCIAAGLLIDRRLVFMLPVSGLCMSIVFPTITASVSRLHPTNSGTIIGLLFAFSGLGGALGPWIVGLFSQAFGLQIGLSTTLVFNGLALLAWLILRRQHRQLPTSFHAHPE